MHVHIVKVRRPAQINVMRWIMPVLLRFNLQGIGAAASVVGRRISVLGLFRRFIAYHAAPLRHVRAWQPHSPNVADIGLRFPAGLPVEAQWSRVTKIVEATLCHARNAGAYHAMAGLRLDAAEYAFGRMMEELRPVVARPIMVSAVPRPVKTQVVTAPPDALAA
jgi:hypothetical protein